MLHRTPPESESPEVYEVIINEFCRVISAGLTVLYPKPQDQLALMYKLLTQGTAEGSTELLGNHIGLFSELDLR